MFSREQLRTLVNEKLAVAAEEILGLLEVKVEEYEEEIRRQRRLLDVFLKPQLKLHRTDFRQNNVYMDKQDFSYNECNAGLASDPPQNEEQLSRPQKEEQYDGMFFSMDEEHNHSDNDTLDLNHDNSLRKSLVNMPVVNADLSEPNLQLFSNSSYEVKDQKGNGQDVSESTIQEAPNNLQYKGQHVYKEEEEEVDISKQQWITDRNSGLDEEDTKLQQMKAEYVGNTEVEEQVLKEADAFALGHIGEEHSGDQSQHRNPGESLKHSVTKSSLSCERKVTRRVSSGSTRQDKSKTQKQQQKGKRHAKNDKQPTKLKRCNLRKREKAFKCDTCGKVFNFKSNLRIHVRIHTGEKPYACPTCGKCFTQQGHLCSHILIHTGERPHVCTTCKKSFTRKKELCTHMQVHPGQHPYVCATCGKGFFRKKDLVAHKKVHKIEKPNICRTCGKVFKQKHSLNYHMRIHKST